MIQTSIRRRGAELLRVWVLLLLGGAALPACGPVEPEIAPPPGPAAAGSERATLLVSERPQQRFAGFGFSFEHDTPYLALTEAGKAEVDRLLFEELDTRIVRLWHAPGDAARTARVYQDSGILARAQAGGVVELLLAPGGYTGDPAEQARLIADDIGTLRERFRIPITATGVINEPGSEPGEPHHLPAEDYATLALELRAALDAAGLSEITVLGPEFASADDVVRRWTAAMDAAPDARAAIDALATHSYNMAATPELGAWARAHDKTYWMTEAGGGLVDGSGRFDYAFGASASARFLNDLNNGVTHWVWFVGLGEGTEDVLQKLVMCEGRCAGPDRIYKNFAYHHVQAVVRTFPPGTVIRRVTSDLPGFPDLTWTYGPKPPLNAVAGLRPDGRFAIAVVNDTPGGGGEWASWAPPTDYEVTIQVPELAGAQDLTFEVCRTGPQALQACGEQVALEDGRISLRLASLQLATLVAATP